MDDAVRVARGLAATPSWWERILPRWLRRSDHDWFVVAAGVRTTVLSDEPVPDEPGIWERTAVMSAHVATVSGPWTDAGRAYQVADLLRAGLAAEGLDERLDVVVVHEARWSR